MQKSFEDADYSYLKTQKFPVPNKQSLETMDCKDYWFPLNMTEFKAWYAEEFGEEEEEILIPQP